MKRAMSAMGYAIVIFILIGVAMIVSAPMMLDNYKYDAQTPKGDIAARVNDLEVRVNNLEDAQQGKYICKKQKGSYESNKFVLVCEFDQ